MAYKRTVLLAQPPFKSLSPIWSAIAKKLVLWSTSPEPFSGQWVKQLVHHGKLLNRVVRVARPDLGSPLLKRQRWWISGDD
jgi:hypothetical protein